MLETGAQNILSVAVLAVLYSELPVAIKIEALI